MHKQTRNTNAQTSNQMFCQKLNGMGFKMSRFTIPRANKFWIDDNEHKFGRHCWIWHWHRRLTRHKTRCTYLPSNRRSIFNAAPAASWPDFTILPGHDAQLVLQHRCTKTWKANSKPMKRKLQTLMPRSQPQT